MFIALSQEHTDPSDAREGSLDRLRFHKIIRLMDKNFTQGLGASQKHSFKTACDIISYQSIVWHCFDPLSHLGEQFLGQRRIYIAFKPVPLLHNIRKKVHLFRAYNWSSLL